MISDTTWQSSLMQKITIFFNYFLWLQLFLKWYSYVQMNCNIIRILFEAFLRKNQIGARWKNVFSITWMPIIFARPRCLLGILHKLYIKRNPVMLLAFCSNVDRLIRTNLFTAISFTDVDLFVRLVPTKKSYRLKNHTLHTYGKE